MCIYLQNWYSLVATLSSWPVLRLVITVYIPSHLLFSRQPSLLDDVVSLTSSDIGTHDCQPSFDLLITWLDQTIRSQHLYLSLYCSVDNAWRTQMPVVRDASE